METICVYLCPSVVPFENEKSAVSGGCAGRFCRAATPCCCAESSCCRATTACCCAASSCCRATTPCCCTAGSCCRATTPCCCAESSCCCAATSRCCAENGGLGGGNGRLGRSKPRSRRGNEGSTGEDARAPRRKTGVSAKTAVSGGHFSVPRLFEFLFGSGHRVVGDPLHGGQRLGVLE